MLHKQTKSTLMAICLISTLMTTTFCNRQKEVPEAVKFNKEVHGLQLSQFTSSFMERYPQATLQDLYKTLFQDNLGPSHIINGYESVRKYIDIEVEECGSETMYGSYYEPCGWRGDYYRVSLFAIKDGIIDAGLLTECFIKSNSTIGDSEIDEWKSEWREAMEIVGRFISNRESFARDSAAIEELFCRNSYVLHHSRQFTELYRPHYRIIKREIFEEHLLPLFRKNEISGRL